MAGWAHGHAPTHAAEHGLCSIAKLATHHAAHAWPRDKPKLDPLPKLRPIAVVTLLQCITAHMWGCMHGNLAVVPALRMHAGVLAVAEGLARQWCRAIATGHGLVMCATGTGA